jgi:hypothetical protein
MRRDYHAGKWARLLAERHNEGARCDAHMQ